MSGLPNTRDISRELANDQVSMAGEGCVRRDKQTAVPLTIAVGSEDGEYDPVDTSRRGLAKVDSDLIRSTMFQHP
jgi:hypothetical protein